jgi:hypothetical protein
VKLHQLLYLNMAPPTLRSANVDGEVASVKRRQAEMENGQLFVKTDGKVEGEERMVSKGSRR